MNRAVPSPPLGQDLLLEDGTSCSVNMGRLPHISPDNVSWKNRNTTWPQYKMSLQYFVYCVRVPASTPVEGTSKRHCTISNIGHQTFWVCFVLLFMWKFKKYKSMLTNPMLYMYLLVSGNGPYRNTGLGVFWWHLPFMTWWRRSVPEFMSRYMGHEPRLLVKKESVNISNNNNNNN